MYVARLRGEGVWVCKIGPMHPKTKTMFLLREPYSVRSDSWEQPEQAYVAV